MVYAVTFTQDTDKPGVGTATVRDEATGFTMSARVDTNDTKAIDALVATVKAKAASVLSAKVAVVTVADKIAAALNAEKVG